MNPLVSKTIPPQIARQIVASGVKSGLIAYPPGAIIDQQGRVTFSAIPVGSVSELHKPTDEDCREAFRLRAHGFYTHKEISKRLSIPFGSVARAIKTGESLISKAR